MTVALGVDLGARRIGIAIADAGPLSVRPLVTLARGADVAADAAAIGALIRQHAVTELVVGLPLEAAGQEGPQATLTRDWVDGLTAILGDDVRIEFQDERLSSYLAEQRLGPMRRGRSGGPPTRHQRDDYRARVDREAAAIILHDALDGRTTTTETHP
jgi:putative Holliday junction resolvase